jgi:glycosyltransferase involved in cell wall biosynthesis
MTLFSAYIQSRGGAFRLWVRLLAYAAKEGNRVHYASDRRVPELEAAGCVYHHVPHPAGRLGAVTFLICLYFRCLFRPPSRATIAISQGSMYSAALAPLGQGDGAILTVVHGDYPMEWKAEGYPGWSIRLFDLLRHFGLRRSSEILPVSRDLARRTREDLGVPEPAIAVEVNAMPAIRERPPREPGRGLRLIFVGNLVRIKRVDVLLDALANLDLSFSCHILGDGPLRSELERQARELGLSDRVFFEGWRDDVEEWLSRSDALVLPSDYEGCPSVLLEALAAGTFAIGSNAGGIPEIVASDEQLFPRGDAAALARRIAEAWDGEQVDPTLLDRWLERRPLYAEPWERRILRRAESWASGASKIG